ncbi:MAG: hypothetical protein HC893_06335 [Chloroflexaceae bacterium]|nr:hypothetical protein [Chloroflexaceae bacterium]
MHDAVFQGWQHRELAMVLVLGLLSVMLWRAPMIGWIFYPFHLFGTFIHELSHGLAAILTGGEFRRFRVDYDLSGRAWSAGGIGWIISSAGYVGSALFGGFLMIITAHAVSARTVLALLGVALGVLCLIFVRNWFGIFSGLAIAGLLILAAERLNATWAYGLLLFCRCR